MSDPAALDADCSAISRCRSCPRMATRRIAGRLLIVGGSREVPGAACSPGSPRMRAGAGKLQIVTDRGGGDRRRRRRPRGAGDRPASTTRDCMSPNRRAAVTRLRHGSRRCRLDCAGWRRSADGRRRHAPGARRGRARLPRRARGARSAAGAAAPPCCRIAGKWRGCSNCEPEEVEIDPLLAGAPRRRALSVRSTLVKGRFSFIAAPDGRAFRFEGGGSASPPRARATCSPGIVGGHRRARRRSLTATLWGVWLHGEAGRMLTDEDRPGRLPGRGDCRARARLAGRRWRPSSVPVQLVADQAGDVDDVGRARHAERHAGGDDDPVAALGEAVAQRHPLRLADHLLEAARRRGCAPHARPRAGRAAARSSATGSAPAAARSAARAPPAARSSPSW